MITAPAATHMGFNTGENYCEAVNFGNRFWLSYVKGRMDAGTYPECSYKHKYVYNIQPPKIVAYDSGKKPVGLKT